MKTTKLFLAAILISFSTFSFGQDVTVVKRISNVSELYSQDAGSFYGISENDIHLFLMTKDETIDLINNLLTLEENYLDNKEATVYKEFMACSIYAVNKIVDGKHVVEVLLSSKFNEDDTIYYDNFKDVYSLSNNLTNLIK